MGHSALAASNRAFIVRGIHHGQNKEQGEEFFMTNKVTKIVLINLH